MKKSMKGGSTDFLIVLLICFFCVAVILSVGGYGYSRKCSDEDNNKNVQLTVDNECFCGFEWCEAGNICDDNGCSPPPAPPPPPPPPPPPSPSNGSNVPPSSTWVPGIDACYPEGDPNNQLYCSKSSLNQDYETHIGYNTGYCFPDLSGEIDKRSCQCTAGWSKRNPKSASGVCD